MPSASSALLLFASLLGVQARVLPAACPAACSDVSAFGIEHHRLQDLSHCGKKIRYEEIFHLKGDELVPEISVCSSGEAAPVEQKRQEANRNKPTEQLVDFHVFSNSSGTALNKMWVDHFTSLKNSPISNGVDFPAGSPVWVTIKMDMDNTTMGIYAGKDVDGDSLAEILLGWGKNFVTGSSTFAGQWCGMGQDKTIGFVMDGAGYDEGIALKYMDIWDQDKCVMDFEDADVWEDVPVTYKNDVWRAVEDPGY